MISKWIGFGLVSVLVAALLAGGAYVVLRPDDALAQRGSGGQNRAIDGTGPLSDSSGRVGRWDDDLPRGPQQGERGGSGVLSPEADHPIGTWVELTGEVVALVDNGFTLSTDDGEMTVHLGPSWYWESVGIGLEAGDQVTVSGFYEDDEFEVGAIENTTDGTSVTLRDETGRPLWAGRGGAGGNTAAGRNGFAGCDSETEGVNGHRYGQSGQNGRNGR